MGVERNRSSDTGEAFLLTARAYLLTVKLLCLQSLRRLLDALSHCKQKKLQLQVKKLKV